MAICRPLGEALKEGKNESTRPEAYVEPLKIVSDAEIAVNNENFNEAIDLLTKKLAYSFKTQNELGYVITSSIAEDIYGTLTPEIAERQAVLGIYQKLPGDFEPILTANSIDALWNSEIDSSKTSINEAVNILNQHGVLVKARELTFAWLDIYNQTKQDGEELGKTFRNQETVLAELNNALQLCETTDSPPLYEALLHKLHKAAATIRGAHIDGVTPSDATKDIVNQEERKLLIALTALTQGHSTQEALKKGWQNIIEIEEHVPMDNSDYSWRKQTNNFFKNSAKNPRQEAQPMTETPMENGNTLGTSTSQAIQKTDSENESVYFVPKHLADQRISKKDIEHAKSIINGRVSANAEGVEEIVREVTDTLIGKIKSARSVRGNNDPREEMCSYLETKVYVALANNDLRGAIDSLTTGFFDEAVHTKKYESNTTILIQHNFVRNIYGSQAFERAKKNSILSLAEIIQERVNLNVTEEPDTSEAAIKKTTSEYPPAPSRHSTTNGIGNGTTKTLGASSSLSNGANGHLEQEPPSEKTQNEISGTTVPKSIPVESEKPQAGKEPLSDAADESTQTVIADQTPAKPTQTQVTTPDLNEEELESMIYGLLEGGMQPVDIPSHCTRLGYDAGEIALITLAIQHDREQSKNL